MPASHDEFAAAFADHPVAVRALLTNIPARGGVLPAGDAAEIMRLMGFDDIGPLMILLLPGAACYALVPVSNFEVGAVAAGMGSPVPNLYLGANIEFPGQALSFTVHAEQGAMNNAGLHGEAGLRAVAVSAAPCGFCRQFLHEIGNAQSLDVLLRQSGTLIPRRHPLTYFLPEAFGPHDLKMTGGLMQPQSNSVPLASSDSVVDAAIRGAEQCYAPYTNNFAAVALLTLGGRVHVGRYAENAAYNPSLAPLASAFAQMNMSEPGGEIARAVLVETPTTVSQRDATIAVLASVAPGVTLEYFAA